MLIKNWDLEQQLTELNSDRQKMADEHAEELESRAVLLKQKDEAFSEQALEKSKLEKSIALLKIRAGHQNPI